jgi:tetratricopeptide (TPR) repeat protein
VRESLQVAAAEQEVIQGQLYRRILQHVHDVRIRKLAHPGLVLRRITPEIIKKVLAGPCIVAVRSAQDAEELFAKFRDEVSLVTQADDGSLHHRADVRKVMLRFLLQDDPARVSRIHDSAIAYYMKQHDVISRAEEIYHRLAQGQDAKLIEARWTDGIESYLKNSIDELPVESQRFLASRLEIELAPEIWSSASQTEQERVIANQATALLEAGRAAAVTDFLSSRSEVTSKSASLTLLEGQAYAALKKTQSAIRAGKKALSLAELNNDRDLRLRAASFLAACYDDTLNPRQARKYYHQAFELANTLKEPIRALEIALSEAVTINEWDKEYQQLTATISNLVMTIEPERLMTQKQLVFDVAASFGHAEPELLRTIVTRYRLPAANEKRLAAVLSKWDRELGRNLKQRWPMAGARDIPNANGWKSPWPKYVASLGTQRTVDMIRSLAERFPIPRAAARAFSALFKSRLGTEALRMTSKVKSKKLKKLLARRKSSVRRRSIGRLKSARKKSRKK